MTALLMALRVQRWDDHRYYHHSRINQCLNLLSAISFLCSYVLLFTNPVAAALLGWLVAMNSRQIGHFFFEPRGFDGVNGVTHEYKEAVKVGYNLRRKVVLLAVWALSPVALLLDPTFLGVFEPAAGPTGFVDHTALIWIAVGLGGLLFRTVQLGFLRDPQTGLVWLLKIVTEPFHDIGLYYKAPLYLIRGQLIDPGESEHRA